MRIPNSKTVHEKYHKHTKEQSKVIKSNNFTYRLLIEVIDEYINPPIKKVLDLGCGAGSISFYLANKDHQVTGLDISQKAINQCIKSADQLGFTHSRFIRGAFPEEIKLKQKFDFVIFTEVIEHLPNDRLALEKIANLLKLHGVLILSTPSTMAPLHRLGLTKKFDKEVGHIRRYSLEQLNLLISNSGFKILEIRKTEGIFRNFLFVNPYAGKFVRYVNFFASNAVTFVDNISLTLFGNSNFIIVAEKVDNKVRNKVKNKLNNEVDKKLAKNSSKKLARHSVVK